MNARQTPVREFVILSYARTGSSQLLEYINQIPKTKCFWEIFKSDFINEPGWKIISQNFSDSNAAKLLHSKSALQFWLELRDITYVENCRVGAKIFYYHRRRDAIWNHLLNKDVGIIHLTRSSTFASFVSLELAKQSGIWSRQSTKWPKKLIPARKSQTPKIQFDVAQYIEYRDDIIQQNQFFISKLAGRPNVLNIEYKQISDKNYMSEILSDFFGINSKVKQTLAKQNSRNKLCHIINKQDAISFVDDKIPQVFEHHNDKKIIG